MSCSLKSEYSLPNSEEINIDLIGTWTTPCIKGFEGDSLKIKALNKKKYKLIFDSNEELISYSIKIKGQEIMNIISNTGNMNTFYGFDVENDTLRFYEVNPEILKKDITSKKELLDFFKNNINKENFFINACIMLKNKK